MKSIYFAGVITCVSSIIGTAQTQSALKLFNNVEADRALNLSANYVDRDNTTGLATKQTGYSAYWSNPVTERINTVFGVTRYDSEAKSAVPIAKTDSDSLGFSMGGNMQVGPIWTTLYGCGFYNSIDSNYSLGSTTSDETSGYAFGVIQPLPLNLDTVLAFTAGYVGVPNQGADIGQFGVDLYHHITDKCTVMTGIFSQWSDESLTLSGQKDRQTAKIGLTYQLNDCYRIGGNISTGLGGPDNEFSVGLSLRFTFKGGNQ